ncbi:MAG: nitroreductase family protein [Lachnospiraceae bacterium]|nr:nitroreductase family protein [Lachnospiraceae bacterium]
MKEIFRRTSVRRFEDREVEQEKIEKILRAGMQSPTAGNQQPWIFYVVKDRDTLQKLAATSPYAGCVKDAPMAIVIVYRQDVRYPEYAQIDCSIAAENIWLEADALDLGSVLLGIAPIRERMDAVRDVLGFPEDQYAFGILPVGYPVSVKPQQDRFDPAKIRYID